MTVFIFEGPDGAGKTYTAEEFSSAVGLPIHHFGGPPESTEEIKQRAKFITKRDNIIFDRIPLISDIIYSKVVRKEESIFSIKDLDFLTDEDDPKKYFVIYCRPSNQTILDVSLETKPHKSKEHLDSVKTNICSVISGYDLIMSEISHIHFNRDYQTCAELIYALEKQM